MALTLEDGTGVADADSFVAVADVTAYLQEHYTTAQIATWTAGSGGDQEIWTRQAAQFMESKYGPSFYGNRTNELQGLPWPRAGVVDYDGYAIDDDVVPQAVIDAQCELAMRAASGRLDSDITPSTANIESESKSIAGISKSVSYGGGGRATQTEYTLVDRLLAPFLQEGGWVVRG